MRNLPALLSVGLLLSVCLPAQAPGLRLLSPLGLNETYIVDGQGNVVHTWPGFNTATFYLLPDGSLLRGIANGTGIPGTTGLLQRMSFDGTVTWEMQVSDTQRSMHHDIHYMPNGNVLVFAVDLLTPADAIAAGRDPATIIGAWMPDSILEIQPTGPTTGVVVWEWHVMDHLVQDRDPSLPNYGVVSDHPELLDINFPGNVLNGDAFNHANGIDYDPVNDWIVVSFRHQSEIYLIDHSTTTAEAAGHTGGARGKGGDFLWRWGNPQAYKGGGPADQWLRVQHDPRWIPAGYPGAGHMTVFNNVHGPNLSAVYELEMPLDANGNPFVDPKTGRYGPERPLWIFEEPGFFSAFVSSAERLANGNTLVCSGQQSRLFEVTPDGQTVWSYDPPGAPFLFQAHAVERRLWADATGLSASAGGQIGYEHVFDTSFAGQFYLLLGSLTGTTPGTPLPGGVLLPLNNDLLTGAMLTLFNTPLFVDTFGVIDATGRASSAIVVGPGEIPAAMVGLEISCAHVVYDSNGNATLASNPTRTVITP